MLASHGAWRSAGCPPQLRKGEPCRAGWGASSPCGLAFLLNRGPCGRVWGVGVESGSGQAPGLPLSFLVAVMSAFGMVMIFTLVLELVKMGWSQWIPSDGSQSAAHAFSSRTAIFIILPLARVSRSDLLTGGLMTSSACCWHLVNREALCVLQLCHWAFWWHFWGMSPAGGEEQWESRVDVLSNFPCAHGYRGPGQSMPCTPPAHRNPIWRRQFGVIQPTWTEQRPE